MSINSLYDDSIKYLHLISTDTGNPLYTQTAPMQLVSITLNTATGFEVTALYNASSIVADDLIISMLVHNFNPGHTLLFNLSLQAFTIGRVVAANDLTIAYRGPTIVL